MVIEDVAITYSFFFLSLERRLRIFPAEFSFMGDKSCSDEETELCFVVVVGHFSGEGINTFHSRVIFKSLKQHDSLLIFSSAIAFFSVLLPFFSVVIAF